MQYNFFSRTSYLKTSGLNNFNKLQILKLQSGISMGKIVPQIRNRFPV